jgi:RimJ/RimL family protein N-acetyltransferase
VAHPPVVLRAATADDLPVLVALAQSPGVAPFLATSAAESLPAALGAADETLLAIEVDGSLAGGARLVVRVARHRLAEVRTLMLDPDLHGRGHGVAAVRALADLAFGRHGLHRLEAEVLGDNGAGARAFERAGFVREGIRRRAWQRGGTWQDGILFGRLADER